ncbi:host attachment family protein [Sphingomonas sp. PR090111-T3T-6A]|uniref:host attachment family protein n=1 Tax=Sphingomonas sp. PR090111-T3T-6A TaxID=685778 RepID=UPI000377C9FB|nr:host attachment family protein [Sphingomonas sp. PR090111-T3T-6A]
MRVPRNSVILVADGRKRLLLRNEGDAAAPNLTVMSAVEEPASKTREMVTDSPGRSFAPNAGGGAFPSADAHEIEGLRFAADTAEMLSQGVQSGDFSDLIVIAPPKTLGQLRKHYHRDVENRILREVSKDMTGSPVGEIEKVLTALD